VRETQHEANRRLARVLRLPRIEGFVDIHWVRSTSRYVGKAGRNA
jgi:hypothetical protein